MCLDLQYYDLHNVSESTDDGNKAESKLMMTTMLTVVIVLFRPESQSVVRFCVCDCFLQQAGTRAHPLALARHIKKNFFF